MVLGSDGSNHILYRSAFLNIVLRHSDRVVEIAVDGEVDLASSEGLTSVISRLGDLISSNDGADPSSVIIDMSEVSFCDGSGIAFLVGMQAKSREAGSDFTVRKASPIVRKLIGILDLDALLEDGGS
jgi:anti-anti-sigma factor